MAEYIEKAAVISKCDEMWENADETTDVGVATINAIDRITDFIEAMPAADVQRVKRGEWGKRAYNRVQCSYCGKCEDIATDFCPNCGADMRGEDNG